MDQLFVAIQLKSSDVGYFIHPWMVILWELKPYRVCILFLVRVRKSSYMYHVMHNG